MKRAIRRQALARMTKKAKKLYPDTPVPKALADHLATCSCWMCGNPRRHLKGNERLTLQERKEKYQWNN